LTDVIENVVYNVYIQPMETSHRSAELHRIISDRGGKRVDAIRDAARELMRSEITVRIWLVNQTSRPIPERELILLKRAWKVE
jgi:hypothetical protein